MFDKFFNSSNPFWNITGHLFDLFVVNVLWLICCIPILTIGPATTAFYYSTIQMTLDDDSSPSGLFFRSFRLNLKQGMLLGVPFTLLLLFLARDIRLCYQTGRGIYSFLLAIFAILLLMVVFMALYLFPLLAKLEKTTPELLALSFTLSLKHIPATLLMAFTLIVGCWIVHLLPGTVFLVFGIVFYLNSHIIVGILSRYVKLREDPPADEEEYEE